MFSCFYKTCPCLPRRDTQPPFNNYSYDDDDDNHLEFENLLAQQDPDSVTSFPFLSREPFSRAPNSQGYLRVHMGPNDDISGGASDRGSVLLDDESQTVDAQFLPDEQISKLTEINGDQSKHSQVTDAELAAEEDEARRLEEQEIVRKRQTAEKIAIAKGLIHPNGDPNKDTIFTIADGDGDDDADEFGNASGTGEFGDASQNNSEEQLSTLNKPRNPHQRLFTSDLNLEDYEDGTESDGPSISQSCRNTLGTPLVREPSKRSIIRQNEQKMEDYSPFSASILHGDDDDDYDIQDDYDPSPTEEEIDHPFLHILPDFSETVGAFFSGFRSSRAEEEENDLGDRNADN